MRWAPHICSSSVKFIYYFIWELRTSNKIARENPSCKVDMFHRLKVKQCFNIASKQFIQYAFISTTVCLFAKQIHVRYCLVCIYSSLASQRTTLSKCSFINQNDNKTLSDSTGLLLCGRLKPIQNCKWNEACNVLSVSINVHDTYMYTVVHPTNMFRCVCM